MFVCKCQFTLNVTQGPLNHVSDLKALNDRFMTHQKDVSIYLFRFLYYTRGICVYECLIVCHERVFVVFHYYLVPWLHDSLSWMQL